MRKDSPDARWPGYVVLPEYLTFSHLQKWEVAIERAKLADEVSPSKTAGGFFVELLPIACSIILEWHIEGLPEKVTADNFPASTKLITFVTGLVMDLYNSTNVSDPKLSEPS